VPGSGSRANGPARAGRIIAGMRSFRILAFLALACAIAAVKSPYWQTASPAVARHAMVVTVQHLATEVGRSILERGGNAVDAAVAVGYALAVVDPCCGNVGGGGFMLVRMRDGRERFIDFRETAPLRATRDMYLDARGNPVPQRSRKGWLAVGVPGTVLGLETARSEYGTMSRGALLAPAIALAGRGFALVRGDSMGPLPLRNGYVREPQLAATLALISRDGPDAFYRGSIARAIVAASQRGGGLLSMRDLATYRVVERRPIHCNYRGYRLTVAPPPSSAGVVLCQILGMIEPYEIGRWPWHGVRASHYVVEADRRAYADRNTYLGDPAYVRVPVAQLLAPSYLARLRASIDPVRATPSREIHPGAGIDVSEGDDTTHYSIVDSEGNAVAVTYTLNDYFGAGVTAGSTGVIMNDEMDDFTSKPGTPNMYGLVQGSANAVAPGKRPLSSMAPTIVTRDGRLVMVTGSPGGSRIPTIVLETLLDVLDYHMNVAQAVDAPRIHMQWLPDEIQYEPGALTSQTMLALLREGYSLKEYASWGSAQAIVVDPVTHALYGGTDDRTPEGAALGY
jgi:gamma-glutamyltranspeptidase/glutathione hydrolase